MSDDLYSLGSPLTTIADMTMTMWDDEHHLCGAGGGAGGGLEATGRGLVPEPMGASDVVELREEEVVRVEDGCGGAYDLYYAPPASFEQTMRTFLRDLPFVSGLFASPSLSQPCLRTEPSLQSCAHLDRNWRTSPRSASSRHPCALSPRPNPNPLHLTH